jgi:hypothetical protein
LIATGFDEPQTGYGPRGGGLGARQPRGPRFPIDEPPTLPTQRPGRAASYNDDPSPFGDDDESEIDIPPFLRGQRRRQR